MTWEEIVAQNKTKLVTKRYKITEEQDKALLEIQEALDIPPSAIVRLALNCFLPKAKDGGFKYEGIKRLWNDNKF